MNYLTKDELLDLHAYMLERYGGRMGIASLDRLMHVLDAPRQVMFGVELYPDLPSKAAALTFLIMKSHPFVGANEATALMALLRFLHINNARLDESVDTNIGWLARAISRSELDRAGLERWVRDNLVMYA